MEELFTVDDVAEFTNLTSRTIRNYLKNGTLKGRKIGGQWRFTKQNITNLLNSKQVKNETVIQNDQFLLDFIEGINTDIVGQLQICTIVDYYCSKAEDALQLNEEFSKIASELKTDAKYLYCYKDEEKKARFIFSGIPEQIACYMDRLKLEWEQLNQANKQFIGRSANYLIGRPDYPLSFFNYLYDEFGMTAQSVIADIGSGIGTMSKHFLERGNTVYCIEPNSEMSALADQLLTQFRGYRPIKRMAEDTRLKTQSINYIICGNSYGSFHKELAIPELKRILKKNGKILLTNYYPDDIPASREMNQLWSEFKNPENHESDKLIGQEFMEGKSIKKSFSHVYQQDFSHFLSGCQSSIIAPLFGEERYDYFINRLKDIFDKYSVDGKMECKFRLSCLIGHIEDLVIK